MKFSYLICCLVLNLCQHAHGIFFSSSWLLNLLNPTTTTTTPSPSASAGAISQNYYNISPQVFVSNEVTATGENGAAYSNLVLAIGQNITGTSRRKRSLFGSVFNTVENGISNAKKVASAITRPARRSLGVSFGGSGRASASGKSGGGGKIGASGSVGGSASSNSAVNSNPSNSPSQTADNGSRKYNPPLTPGGPSSRENPSQPQGNAASQNSQSQTTAQSGRPSVGLDQPKNQPQPQDNAAKQNSSTREDQSSQNQSPPLVNLASKISQVLPSSEGSQSSGGNADSQKSNQSKPQPKSSLNSDSQSQLTAEDPSDSDGPASPSSESKDQPEDSRKTAGQDDQPKENTLGSSPNQSGSSNTEDQKVEKQDTPKGSNAGPSGGSPYELQKPAFPFPNIKNLTQQILPKFPATNSKDPQNSNSSQADDIKNRASNFVSSLQDRFANSPVGGFNPANISQGFGQHFKDPNGPQKQSFPFPNIGKLTQQILPKFPAINPKDPQNSNSSQADDIKNGASNFLSGLGGFNPANISQGFGQHFKDPLAPISDRLNKTNFLQNFKDDVHNFVDQLANNNSGIQNFIANNNLNTSNPIQTFAQLGMNGLIPNPVEILANLSMDQLENQVRDYLNNGLNDVQNAVQGAQSLGSKLASLIPNLAANAIKDIQNMIKLSGVIACVSKQPLPFSNVIQIAANVSSKCVAEKVDQAASIWKQTAANLQNASADLQKLRDSISECSQRVSGSTSLSNAITLNTCYAAALFNIQSETVLLPLSIAQRIAEGVNLANSLKGHMIKCAANLAHEIATQAYTASQAIAKCIVDSTG